MICIFIVVKIIWSKHLTINKTLETDWQIIPIIFRFPYIAFRNYFKNSLSNKVEVFECNGFWHVMLSVKCECNGFWSCMYHLHNLQPIVVFLAFVSNSYKPDARSISHDGGKLCVLFQHCFPLIVIGIFSKLSFINLSEFQNFTE